MVLPVSMRIDTYWNIAEGVSCGGHHIFIVHKPGTDQSDADTQFRILWIKPGEDRWHLTAHMRKVAANTLLAKARTALYRSEGIKSFRRNCDQYARTVMPGRFDKHRKALHARIEERELHRAMQQNSNYGIF